MKRINFIIKSFYILSLTFLSQVFAFSPSVESILSDNLLEVNLSYGGGVVTLFGVMHEGDDIIVEVRGLPKLTKVRKKEKVMGIWVNKQVATFRNVPSYYMLASTGRVESILDENEIRQSRIGVDFLIGSPLEDFSKKEIEQWQGALKELMTRNGVWRQTIFKIDRISDKLFKVKLDFPENVPIGNYEVYIYAVAGKKVIGGQTTSLTVDKAGFSAAIWEASQYNKWLYAFLSLLLAFTVSLILMYIIKLVKK